MMPPGLCALFGKHSLFTDADRDGYPEGIALRISAHPLLEDSFVWAGLLNLTARLAFEVVALSLPILHRSARPAARGPQLLVYPPGHPAPGCDRGLLPPVELKSNGRVLSLYGASGKAMMERLNAFAVTPDRSRQGRPRFKTQDNSAEKISQPLDLLDLACLYGETASQPRGRSLRAVFCLPQKRLSGSVGSALCDLVARLALEATELSLPLAFVGHPTKEGLVFQVEEKEIETHEIRVLGGKGGRRPAILLEGNPRALAASIKSWASWALSSGGRGSEGPDRLRDHVESFRLLLGGVGYWGKWSRLLLGRPQMHAAAVPAVSAKKYPAIVKACRALSLPLPPREKPSTALCRSARWQSETERSIKALSAFPRGHGPLEGVVFVSKPLAERRRLKTLLQGILRARGYEPRLRVLNAYKPALSWLLEEVLPKLKTLGSVASLELLYRPFQGMDGALEMRSRWLQEVFPGPDLLGLALGIPPGKIKTLCRPDLKRFYEVRAFDARRRLCFKTSLTPPFSRFPYLHPHPELGWVHPTTGGIRLTQGSRVLLDKTLPTDREHFWHIFQTRWLPLLEASMAERVKQESPEGQSAFWEELCVRVSLKETDLPLPIGEERISPLEALHEDVYFVLLRFFSSFARRHHLSESIQLGRVVPKTVNSSAGGCPCAELRAKPLPWHRAPVVKGASLRKPPLVSALSMSRGRWRFELRGPTSKTEAERFLTLARAWGYTVTQGQQGTLLLWLGSPAQAQEAGVPRPPREPAADRLLKAREVEALIRGMSRSPNLRAWAVARSLQNRPVYALEAFSPAGPLPSVAKLRLLKPTLVFNARHHANEISSTNAALRMAWRLAYTSLGRNLLRVVNVVWIPVENVDGVATFEELLPGAKNQILHAARYNALGAEFYGDYFRKPPRFPEASAKTRLWHRWLPEIMVDHHGVPSHEWNQPFSGYAPYGFREFWIPRNFVYACLPFVDEPRHRFHKSARGLSALLKKAMAGLPQIVRWNSEIASRYRRYAREPEPETFPDSRGEPLLALPLLGRTYETNFAVRRPDVTRSEIIVEVPDEVAGGRQLELCVLVHLTVQEALLLSVQRTRGWIEAFQDRNKGLLHLAWVPGGPMRGAKTKTAS